MKTLDNSSVRRADRVLNQERTRELLLTGSYGILSMVEQVDSYNQSGGSASSIVEQIECENNCENGSDSSIVEQVEHENNCKDGSASSKADLTKHNEHHLRAGGYGIPINFVWDGERYIYFHCAPEGHKLASLKANPRVSFLIVGASDVISHKFTANYESVIVRGKACKGLTEQERMIALELFLDKYSPNDKEIGMKYAEKSFHRTEIIRLKISSISSKAKRVSP